jgi:hypothetical protein
MFTGLNLTDMETFYKVFRKDIVDLIDIQVTDLVASLKSLAGQPS